MAGVSDTTVSFVLSGSKHASRISPDTRDRVLAAAKSLGYSRNLIGTALQRGYSDNVVLLTVTWHLGMTHSATALALSRAAATMGLQLVVIVAGDDDEALATIERLSSLNPYGLVLLWDSPQMPVQELNSMRQAGLPVVDLLPTQEEHVPSVAANREQGSCALTKHLIELGHRRIGFLLDTTNRFKTSNAKLAGYARALKEIGLELDSTLLQEVPGPDFEEGYDAFAKLYERRPDITALMSFNDSTALGAMTVAQDLGLAVPGDISVAGYGDYAEGRHSRPKLTTVAFPAMHIARRAVQFIMDMRAEPDQTPSSHYADMELIVRESTGPAKQ